LVQCWVPLLHLTYCSKFLCGLELSSQCSAPSCFLGCRDLGYTNKSASLKISQLSTQLRYRVGCY
jgi:hypothetical protein